MMQNNCLNFQYPTKIIQNWTFEFPSDLNEKTNWLWYDWETVNKNGASKWVGKIRFGFKKIEQIWLVGPEEAIKEWKVGHKRLINYLLDLMENLELDDDIEDTRLFK